MKRLFFVFSLLLLTSAAHAKDFGIATFKGVTTFEPDGSFETCQVNDGSIDYTDGNGGTAGTLTIDASGNLSYNKNLSSINNTTNGILTVRVNGSDETFQVSAAGIVEFTDGAAGTTGTMTVNSGGNISFDKNISANLLAASTTSAGILTSNGIDDNADATAITLSSAEVVRFNGSTYTANGTVSTSNGDGTLVTASDKRLKNHVRNFDEEALPLIDLLQPVIYTWKSDNGKNPYEELGFYAQDVNAIEPIIAPKTTVILYKDADGKNQIKGVNVNGETDLKNEFLEADDTVESTDIAWGMHDRGLIALLVKGLQEEKAARIALQDAFCSEHPFNQLCQ